ncbi:MAG: hypothetical protein RL071_2404 [Pseudomonadota bacterium]|jgi:hypothetical protein
MKAPSSLIASALLPLLLLGCGDLPKADESDTGGAADEQVVTYDDADADTILDIHEGEVDTDGDGTANYLDDDSDNDSIKDFFEAGDGDPLTMPLDSDGDTTPDYLDLDSDNNCVPDVDEKIPTGDGPIDTDSDGIRDFADPDNDGDGILDTDEIGGACGVTDTDGDGVQDYMDTDADGDGVGDLYEAGTTEWDSEVVDTDGDGTPDYLDSDSDGDSVSDRVEGAASEDGVPRDTDGDGVPDFQDTDADGDSISDWDELNTTGTDPYDADSDGDGFSDGGERAAGTDPLDPGSVVDGIYVEVPERTNIEELFTFTLQVQLGDIAFLIDTTGSMGGTANAMASEFSTIVSTLSGTIPDAQYGVGTYDDYAYGSFGYSSSGDKPFIMRQQITDNVTQVNNVLNTQVVLHFGGDGPESSMEALLQGAGGLGYDQNCDRYYDGTTDVQPFLASSADPFGGTGGQSYSSAWTGGGAAGGFGFRDYALPVLVYATDYDLRDPDAGYPTPGGCPTDAGQSDVVAALSALNGYAIGIHVNSYTTTPYNQMLTLAAASGSYADTDADGVSDDPLVFQWSGSNAAFRTTITGAIEDLVSSIRFDRVSLDIEGDEWGFVTGVTPEFVEDIDPSGGTEEIDFTLNFRGVVAATTEDQLYRLTLNVIGDGSILLDTLDIIVLVPGSSY